MRESLTLALGARYAFARRSSLSFISLIATGGLALSVAVLVIVVSVINGFERELEERVFGVLPHVMLQGRGTLVPSEDDRARLDALAGVAGTAPFVQGTGLAAVAGHAVGVLVWGVDSARQGHVSDYGRYLEGPQQGALQAGAYRVILGAGVAARLGVGVGDSVALVLPTATVTPAGVLPRQKRFTVSAILRSRSEVDARAALIHIGDAQRLFRLGGGIHGYQLKLVDLFAAERVARAGVDALGFERVYASTWMRTHGNLYRAIGVQKSTMFVLLSFLVAVAAFNLVSTLVMVVNQRSGDVAILRTLGAGTGLIVRAFVLLGLLIGATGIAAGAVLGTLIAAALPGVYRVVTETFTLDLMNQYFVSYLPVQIRLGDLTGIVVTALVLAGLSTLYPAWRAAVLKPSRVLAHE
ncbi:MAG: lipoprotein-releasing ABC transporter permease subunit [Pseudomonadales bacterium]|nr:lipoprotein-releasing ABC transporter permease subunit [Pseudomonadales bacterium]